MRLHLDLYAPGCCTTASGEPFLFQVTLGGGTPDVSQLRTDLSPVVTVKLNGPGLMEGPTEGTQDRSSHLAPSETGNVCFRPFALLTKHP